MIRSGLPAAVVVAAGMMCARPHAQSAGTAALSGILAGLAARVQEYYDRISTIVCVETVTQQEVRLNLKPVGRPRVTVYELSVRRDPKGAGEKEFLTERILQSVNGSRAKAREKPGCTDPKTGTPEPLAFLLEKNQARFRFSLPRDGSGGPEGSRALDFVQSVPDRIKVKWDANCFTAEGGGTEGRVWFDPETFDVLQLQARLPKPFSVATPGSIGPPLRVERSEIRVRFKRVQFVQPQEVVLLPESTEATTIFRGAASLKTTQILSDYKRFMAETTILTPAR